MTRWKINEAAREVLEDQYMRKRFPSPISKKRLAEQLDVAPRRIQVWFQNRRQREKAGSDEPEETPRQSPSFEDELDGVGDDGVGDDLWSASTEPTVRADWQQRDPWGSETSQSPMRSDWQQDTQGQQEWQQQDAKAQQELQLDAEAQQDALMEMANMSEIATMSQITNLVHAIDANDAYPGASTPANFLSSSDDIFQAQHTPPLPHGPAPDPEHVPEYAPCPVPNPCPDPNLARTPTLAPTLTPTRP